MSSQMLVFLLLSIVSTVAPSLAAGEKYQFLTGESICVDTDRVLEKRVTAVFGGGHELTSISVRSDSTVVEMTPDKLLNGAYFHDLAVFMRAHPSNVSSEPGGELLQVDVVIRPAAEVDSMRLLDRLAPGDGTTSFVVSQSLRELDEPPPYERLSDIFLAKCWSGRDGGGSRCQRQFPILGFRAGYSVARDWEGVVKRDQEIRSRLAALVRPCD